MKKVLILTVTAGNGHNSAANSMKNMLENAGVEVKIVDIMKELTSKLNAWTIDKGYNISVGYLRPIYDVFYDRYLKSDIKKANVCGAQTSVKNLNGKLLKIIYEYQPDVIYATSFYGGVALANLRRCFQLPSKNISCMLDYVVSPFWEATVEGLDYLTLSHEDFREELIKKGFSSERLIVTGIPIHAKFDNIIDKSEARKRLGLKDMFTVLVFYGGGHWGGALKVFKTLKKNIKKEIQIIVVNGHNEKAKKKIDSLKLPKNIHVKNIGFTKEVDMIMAASDVMIGKGGGLSMTEAINMKLPLIATKKLPGQEYYNVKYLERKGTGLVFNNEKDLIEKIENLYENPELLHDMTEKLNKLKTEVVGAGKKLFELIMSMPEADYSAINKKIDYDQVNKIVNKKRKMKKK